ncbi:tRNA-dihydrouridine synthase 2 [Rhizina undulata]
MWGTPLQLFRATIPIPRAFAATATSQRILRRMASSAVTGEGSVAADSTTKVVGKCVLAPMVRTGELPTRLMALKYGADLVWGPETVDKAIIGCTRKPNPTIGCIDYVKPQNGGKYDEKIVFRLCPEAEQGKLIFQLGTADPGLAVEAAKVIAGDVAGLDLNAGCPKHFSIHSGMGAGLLKVPEKLTSILSSLVTEVGVPNSLPISVKIRLLEPPSATLDLIHQLCKTGIVRVTVHCRTTPMRPRDPAIRDVLADIASICHSYGVECFANGDIESRSHAEQIIKEYGVDGCMIARAAETNPSVFSEKLLPWDVVAKEYLKTSMERDNHVANTKFCLSHLIPGKEEVYQLVSRSKSVEKICEALGVEYRPVVKPEVEGKKESEKVDSKAVEKAKKGSDTVKAAGGGGAGKKKEKKLNQRGVNAQKGGNPQKKSNIEKGISVAATASII